MLADEELLKVLDKIAETICIVTGNLLCPSYHGLVKYNHVNKKLSEMKAMINSLKEFK